MQIDTYLRSWNATGPKQTIVDFVQQVNDPSGADFVPEQERIAVIDLELLKYLRANSFKTYIVSGGGIEFMRSWVENV